MIRTQMVAVGSAAVVVVTVAAMSVLGGRPQPQLADAVSDLDADDVLLAEWFVPPTATGEESQPYPPAVVLFADGTVIAEDWSVYPGDEAYPAYRQLRLTDADYDEVVQGLQQLQAARVPAVVDGLHGFVDDGDEAVVQWRTRDGVRSSRIYGLFPQLIEHDRDVGSGPADWLRENVPALVELQTRLTDLMRLAQEQGEGWDGDPDALPTAEGGQPIF